MRQFLIAMVIILSLTLAGLVGYLYGSHKSSSSTETVNPPIVTPPSPAPKPPRVFEKYVEAVMPTWTIDLSESKAKIIDLRPAQTLKFPVVAGSRFEGEVVADRGNGVIFALVRDPYGNIILENREKRYPWQFALSAVSTGDYSLEVNTGEVLHLMWEALISRLLSTTNKA